jgi:hypothetical protein
LNSGLTVNGQRSTGIVSTMKRLIPVIVTATFAVVAVAALKMLEDKPLPDPPSGIWELDIDGPAS